MCHVSNVTCHVSGVTCQLSHVTCQFFFLFFFFFFFLGQSGEASQGRVCYQRGLPRLVLVVFKAVMYFGLKEEEVFEGNTWFFSLACSNKNLLDNGVGAW